MSDTYRWECMTMEAAFAPRDGAGILPHNGKMWLLGGWNQRNKEAFPRICSNDVWSSIDGVEWTLEKENTYQDTSFDPASDWEGRHTAGYVLHRDKMWIVGGDANQGYHINDVWSSEDGETWTELPDTPWKPRHAASVCVYDDALWMVTGNNMESDAWKLVKS